jgi:hypothetical protein
MEVIMETPFNATIKFFHKEKGFGFLKTPDGSELFFHALGHHRPERWHYSTRSVPVELDEKQKAQLLPGVEVTVKHVSTGDRGEVADIWEAPFLFEPPPLYFVFSIHRDKKESETQDRERKMWVTHKEEVVTALPIFAGDKVSAETVADHERRQNPGERFLVVMTDHDTWGHIRVPDEAKSQLKASQEILSDSGGV